MNEFKTRRYQRWHVRFALYRMNQKLMQQIGETEAEKRGMRWALTGFARRAWRLTKEEMEQGDSED